MHVCMWREPCTRGKVHLKVQHWTLLTLAISQCTVMHYGLYRLCMSGASECVFAHICPFECACKCLRAQMLHMCIKSVYDLHLAVFVGLSPFFCDINVHEICSWAAVGMKWMDIVFLCVGAVSSMLLFHKSWRCMHYPWSGEAPSPLCLSTNPVPPQQRDWCHFVVITYITGWFQYRWRRSIPIAL